MFKTRFILTRWKQKGRMDQVGIDPLSIPNRANVCKGTRDKEDGLFVT